MPRNHQYTATIRDIECTFFFSTEDEMGYLTMSNCGDNEPGIDDGIMHLIAAEFLFGAPSTAPSLLIHSAQIETEIADYPNAAVCEAGFAHAIKRISERYR